MGTTWIGREVGKIRRYCPAKCVRPKQEESRTDRSNEYARCHCDLRNVDSTRDMLDYQASHPESPRLHEKTERKRLLTLPVNGNEASAFCFI
jgi:hypothetical protein